MVNWTPEYSVHIREIDGQHNTIVAVCSELSEFIQKGGDRQVLGIIIKKLISIATFHFATEEKYFLLFQYEGTEPHTAIHRAMLGRLADFHRKFFDEGKDVAAELVEFTMMWLTDHILQQDKKYVKCFTEHGLK